MIDLYIDLCQWVLHLSCSDPDILEKVGALFLGRCSSTDTFNKEVLHCTIITGPEVFRKIYDNTNFDGPTVDVSQGVKISYCLSVDKTVFHVSHTAIIEIDHKDIHNSTVYVDSYKPEMADHKRNIIPDPEAFLYPLLAEWIRYFGACLIHCGAVLIDDRAVVLSGPPGSGKSTNVIRLLHKGAQFLADDLAILYKDSDGAPVMLPLREVANVNQLTVEQFPELSYIKDAPLRGDKKYCVNIAQYFNMGVVKYAKPGCFVHLIPDSDPWMRRLPSENIYDNIHSMAWFVSRPELTEEHFSLISEWLESSSHWCVSQGFIRSEMDTFLDKIKEDLVAHERSRLSVR